MIDYDLNEQLANREDLDQLKNMGIDLKLDFILNHASAQSPQFQDLVEKGEASAYRDFFIDWNRFWEGHGTMTEEGYIQPEESCLKQMFFRKPGLPILMVEFPDGKKVPYWNTFYQEVHGRHYLGQMDVNIQSPKVWEFYRETKKYTRRLQKKAMRPTTFSCRDWSLMRLRTGAEHTLQHGRRKLWKRRSPRSTCLAVTTASRFWI